jgi:hypothetical protein
MNRHFDIATHLPLISLLVVAPMSGCDETGEAEVAFRDDGCTPWRCGYNTSEVNGKSLQELHLGGDPNDDGVELVGFLAPAGVPFDWELDVEGDALVARGGQFGNSTLSGDQLIGSTLLLQVESNLVVPVVVADHDEVESWASNGEPVSAYALVYADLDTPSLLHGVCKGTLVDPLMASVVVLAGERYDLEDKTVIADQDGWITLACAGSAAAKMALLGYGPNAELEGDAAPASVAQRQATLKMITADYCGTGHSYTVDGTPLLWENQSGTVVLDPEVEPGAHEAIWTANGALCLDTPRVVDPGEVSCSLPSCDGYTLDDGEWATHAVAD